MTEGGTAAREWTTRRENSRRLDTDPGCLSPAAFRARGRSFHGPVSDPAADAGCARPACRPGSGGLYLPVLQFGDRSAAFRALHDNDHSGKKPAACGWIPDFLSHRGDADARGSPAELARASVAVPRERASHVLIRYAGA